jgi:hypothetical protein
MGLCWLPEAAERTEGALSYHEAPQKAIFRLEVAGLRNAERTMVDHQTSVLDNFDACSGQLFGDSVIPDA